MSRSLNDGELAALVAGSRTFPHITNVEREVYQFGVTLISYINTVDPEIYKKLYIGGAGGGAFGGGVAILDAIRRAGAGKNTVYVYTDSSQILGATQSQATERLKELGEKKMGEKKFDEARKFFNSAYHLGGGGHENRDQLLKKRDEAEKAAKKEKARSRYEEAQILWNEAFTAEMQNNVDEATAKFKKSHNIFTEAASLDSTNQIFRNWVDISGLKLLGDEIFNEAVTIHEKANSLRQRERYEEARQKYEEAKSKYLKGLQKSNDKRFQTCVDVVDESIKEINDLIDTGIREQIEKVHFNKESKDKNTQSENLETNEVNYHLVIDSKIN